MPSTGDVLTFTNAGQAPTYQTPGGGSGTVTSVSVVTANGFAGTVATSTTTPAITLTTSQTGLISGNGTALTGTAITQYNVITGGASNAPNSVSPGSTSGVPLISQGASSQPVFGTAVVAGGGTGNTTFTAYSVICAGTTSTGAFQNVSGVGTSGQVLTSNGASALPTWQAGGGGGGGITWNDQVTSSVTMAAANGYVCDDGATLVTLTLPATATFGAEFWVVGKGSGLWTIAEASGQSIVFGNVTTTTTTGSLSSTLASDYVHLLCTTANTVFTVIGSNGNITYV